MSATSSQTVCEIFLAFAGPDEVRANALYELLAADGKQVFLSSHIEPGDNWVLRIRKAISDAKLVVFLHSRHSRNAHYQTEELLSAIKRVRVNETRIVPVYLDGPPDDDDPSTYGLESIQAIDARDVSDQQVAQRLLGLAGGSAPASPEPAPPRPSTYGEWLHAFGMSIDRTDQWEPVVTACRGDESAMFLVHGHQRQNVELFILRVWHYLNEYSGRHHEFVTVPLRVEFAKPRSSAAWMNHLRVGLGADSTPAADALHERCRKSAVFIALSEFPLERGDLDEEELGALTNFLEGKLPELIRKVARRNPVRVLLATQHARDDDSLVEPLHAALKRGAKTHGLHYRWLPPLRSIDWEHIEEWLRNRDDPPPERIFRELRERFDELVQRDVRFHELLEGLSRRLF